ncbi:MAG TPA: hypothetical protein VGR37_10195 [Longimicrobiaceae bacterium]|nr:hypothetical protein [Longimicrobiaceae bacterium]
MVPVLLALLVAAGCTAVLWMEKRHSGEFHQQLIRLHEERARFWRKRLQADDPALEPDAARRLQAECGQHFGRVRATLDALRSRSRELAADSWAVGPECDRELAEMQAALAGSAWDRAAALQRIGHASREVAALRPERDGSAPVGAFLLHGAFGAALGALAGFAIPYRFTHGFYLEDSASPLVAWTVGGALTGFLLGGLGREWVWQRVLPDEWLREGPRRVLFMAACALAPMVAAYWVLYSPPTERQRGEVLRALAAEARCPRPLPRIAVDSLAHLGASDRCAVFWGAAAALPLTPNTQGLLQRNDTTGVRVSWFGEMKAAKIVWIPLIFESRHVTNLWTWEVAVAFGGGELYFLSVDKRTGRARLRFPDRTGPASRDR